ncbi:MAG TPA: hypothetical protein GX404_03575 [Syntrophomonadaceae bacterium]|nr:hypothetical protein [Syntrophomonadaceae bacterium]
MIDPIHISTLQIEQSRQQQAQTKEQSFQTTLEQAQKNQDKEKLMEACLDLESVFINQVFDNMRKTIPEGGLWEKSFAMSTYESMLFEEYSNQISRTSSIGIAELLYKQLARDI